MKKILFLLAFLPALAHAQLPGVEEHHGIYWNAKTVHLGINSPTPEQAPVTHFDGKSLAVSTCDTIVLEDFVIQNLGFRTSSLPTYGFRVPDCEPWETFTDWAAKNAGKAKCAHEWVVAEWNEVNTAPAFTTLEMPPPCGRMATDNEARICRHCLRHETRVRTHGMKEVERKSEYQSLLEKINDR